MTRLTLTTLVAAAALALLGAAPAMADVNIGISLSLTGPGSGLGIPMQNQFKLWPQTIGGEKVNVVILDDASDPGKGVTNARRFITEDKVDLIIGSCLTPVAAAMAPVAAEAKTVQLAASPVGGPNIPEAYLFRLPQGNDVMAYAVVEHMKKQGIKTVGFLGYVDAYGELWLKALTPLAEKAGIKIVATERFQRTDTSVTPQALKLTSANPDAMLIVASGSGAAMPHKAIVERGYKGKIYQTHGVANADFLRVGGKNVQGTLLPAGPILVAEQLPDSNPSKKVALEYKKLYEGKHGAGSLSTFGGHAWDTVLILQAAVPEALKRAKPGTAEFRAALRDAIENTRDLRATHGVFNMSPQDHNGLDQRARVMVTIDKGQWKLVQ
jgi:branched-chain amino acid transport system substrate-binding protein